MIEAFRNAGRFFTKRVPEQRTSPTQVAPKKFPFDDPRRRVLEEYLSVPRVIRGVSVGGRDFDAWPQPWGSGEVIARGPGNFEVSVIRPIFAPKN